VIVFRIGINTKTLRLVTIRMKGMMTMMMIITKMKMTMMMMIKRSQ